MDLGGERAAIVRRPRPVDNICGRKVKSLPLKCVEPNSGGRAGTPESAQRPPRDLPERSSWLASSSGRARWGWDAAGAVGGAGRLGVLALRRRDRSVGAGGEPMAWNGRPPRTSLARRFVGARQPSAGTPPLQRASRESPPGDAVAGRLAAARDDAGVDRSRSTRPEAGCVGGRRDLAAPRPRRPRCGMGRRAGGVVRAGRGGSRGRSAILPAPSPSGSVGPPPPRPGPPAVRRSSIRDRSGRDRRRHLERIAPRRPRDTIRAQNPYSSVTVVVAWPARSCCAWTVISVPAGARMVHCASTRSGVPSLRAPPESRKLRRPCSWPRR